MGFLINVEITHVITNLQLFDAKCYIETGRLLVLYGINIISLNVYNYFMEQKRKDQYTCTLLFCLDQLSILIKFPFVDLFSVIATQNLRLETSKFGNMQVRK